VEHLVASANGGRNGDDNCVACCKSLNALFGSMSLKEKIRLVLNQKGPFACPNKVGARKAVVADARLRPSLPQRSKALSENLARVVVDLHRRGSAKPRTVKTLSSTISALFQKKIPEHEIAALIECLRTDRVIAVAGTKVSYDLPGKAA